MPRSKDNVRFRHERILTIQLTFSIKQSQDTRNDSNASPKAKRTYISCTLRSVWRAKVKNTDSESYRSGGERGENKASRGGVRVPYVLHRLEFVIDFALVDGCHGWPQPPPTRCDALCSTFDDSAPDTDTLDRDTRSCSLFRTLRGSWPFRCCTLSNWYCNIASIRIMFWIYIRIRTEIVSNILLRKFVS